MKAVLSISVFSMVCAIPLCAQQSPEGGQAAFADSLFQEGDYLNAAREYKRLRFQYPHAPRSDFIAFRVAASYQNAGKLEHAIRAYRLLLETYPKSILVERATNNIAQCQILLGHNEQGIASLERFLSDYSESDLAPLAHFTIGMLHMNKGQWLQAGRVWNDAFVTYPESPFAEVSDRLAGAVKTVDTLPRRAPAVAGILSAVIPGSGQIYSGRTTEGLYAFLTVTLLSSASLYYADRERYEVAVPVGLLGLFFYGNSIYRSIRAADAFSVQHKARFRTRIQQQIRESGLFGAIAPAADDVQLVLWRAKF